MTVTIRYRTPMGAFRHLTLEELDPAYARALWLSHPTPEGPMVQCTIDQVPAEATIGTGQDPEPYCSPRYDRPPSALQLIDDEERRRRFVEQARRTAAYLRKHLPGVGGGFRRLAAVLVLLCAALPLPGVAQERETMVAAADRSSYVSRDQAAIAALELSMEDRRTRHEYAGLVYRDSTGYGFTKPVLSRTPGSFSLRLRRGVDWPASADVVAIYHTHPRAAGRTADAHSPEDVEVARRVGLSSYIGVVATGTVLRFDPTERASAPGGYPRGSHRGVPLR